MDIKASMLLSAYDAVGDLHKCPSTQGVLTQGTIEMTQAVRLPLGTRMHWIARGNCSPTLGVRNLSPTTVSSAWNSILAII